MNAHKYLKPYAIVPVTMDAIRDLVELGKQQADRIAELEKDGKVCATCGGLVYDPVIKQTKPLIDEVLNKAFDYYCETDEGVLRFDFDLRTEWKQEQLQRWKEAFRKAWD